MSSLAERVIACCRGIALCTEEPGGTTRTFLSPPMRDVHRILGEWMRGLGMQVRVDAAGNLRGLHGDPRAPRLLIGSHLDTVPNAGAFDGILGVVMGVAMVEARPRMAVEVVGFSEEEGVRFGLPFIGSRALVGSLDLAAADPGIAEAIREFGLDPAGLADARLAPETVGYLEFHIEQGPVLESLDLPLGVVDAIAGQSRFTLTFEGKANHAGTTPMALRNDALVAAARWICEVERYAAETPGLVATVGSVKVEPNAVNVIPGRVRASLDVRHGLDAVRQEAVRALLAGAGGSYEQHLDQPAVRMDAGLTAVLAAAVPGARMVTSGAGHDAMILAPYVPSAMLFLRSPGGISHHPDETVLVGDVEAAIAAGGRFIGALGNVYTLRYS
jgi:allantoate deiminase